LSDTDNDKNELNAKMAQALKALVADHKNQNTIFYGRWSSSIGEMSEEECIKVILQLNNSSILKKGKNETRLNVGEPEFMTLKKYIFYATPSHLGRAVAGVSNIDGGFYKVGSNLRLNHDSYPDIPFDLYQSENALNGRVEFHIRFYDLE
jgi:hypothetical protein